MHRSPWRWLLVAVPVLFSGCGWLTTGNQMGQAQVKNFETRTVDAPFDTVYEAATEALFDLGYVIRHSEKASGIIVGEKQRTESYSVYLGKGLWDQRERQITHDLTLLIKPDGKKSSNVRIQTSVNGQPQFNKEAIDQVWVYIDRQVLMETPPHTDSGKKSSSRKHPEPSK